MILSGKDVLESKKMNVKVGTTVDENWVLITHEDHVTSAPRAVRVSMRTAVWIVLQECEWSYGRG
jgi:hypothetical protein